mmetsp:Transcript_26003/g.41771  ORF Transcript_26003/g.41771 Transcript_26003/m.41771 type:complete len:293 (+) Transcript_26003:100-978(+)
MAEKRDVEGETKNGNLPMSKKLATENMPFRCYLGYDSHEDVTFEVAKYSMEKYSSVPIQVIPLKRKELRKQGVYKRAQDPKQSTEFTYCRFFVPFLNNYKGWALFADDDFLWLGDIAELLDQVDDKYAMMCVQHDYAPTESVKLAGRPQSSYPRKNWSSMVLYNCGHPANANLTLDMINAGTGSFLHRFSWITDDALIGSIDYEWNFLVDWYKPYAEKRMPKAVHYTEGGPWFPDYRHTDYAEVWFEHMREYEATLKVPRQLCPYERFSEKGTKFLEGYTNSDEPWTWADEE